MPHKPKQPTPEETSGLLTDMLIKEGTDTKSAGGELVVEPSEPVSDGYALELERSLSETEAEARRIAKDAESGQLQSWTAARQVVEKFQPAPWFIWRLSNFVFARSGETNAIPEGMALGLRRLLFAAASDPFFSDQGKVNHLRKALSILKPDVVAAISVIHAICRRLGNCQFERIWRPILDDAVLRAQIGYFVGEHRPQFGAGRGMLAGFAGRCGLAILIASGDLDQARRALELLATGADIGPVGLSIYGCDPLQVSAMTLSASGCGKAAAFGTVSYAVSRSSAIAAEAGEEQLAWLAAFSIVELVRIGKSSEIDARLWETMGFSAGKERATLLEASKTLVRRGHGIPWVL